MIYRHPAGEFQSQLIRAGAHSPKTFSQQTLYLLKRPDIRFENLRSLLAKPDVVENPRNYVMIIDEINRGNIPRVLGN